MMTHQGFIEDLQAQLHDSKIKVRLKGALLAVALGGNMVIDALRVMTPQSMTSKVAYLSTYPSALVAIWLLAALLVLPYFLMQALDVFETQRVRVTRLACWAVIAGSVQYAYMGFVSRSLDYKYITAIFVATSLVNLGVAAALAYGINLSQIRAEDKIKKEGGQA